MIFFKTLNELQTTTWCIALCLMLSQLSYGQVSPGALPNTETYIDHIEVIGIDQMDEEGTYHEVSYEVDVNVDIDLGFIDEASVTEISFDIQLAGFNSWSMDANDFELNEADAQTTVTPNANTSNLYHISTTFGDGIDNSNLAIDIIRIASTALVIDNKGDGRLNKTYDCFDYHVEQAASVHISNVVISGNNPSGNPADIPVMGDTYTEDFSLPSCVGKGNEVLVDQYNVNLMVKEIGETSVDVAVYMFYQTVNPIQSGEIRFRFSRSQLQVPSFNADPAINATVNNSLMGSVLYFDNLGLPQYGVVNAINQVYLGTLTFNYLSTTPGTTTSSTFTVDHTTVITDSDGHELVGVTLGDNPNFLDDELFSIQHFDEDEGAVIINDEDDNQVVISFPIDGSRLLNDDELNLLTLSPNPARNYLQINYLSNVEKADFYIYTTEGRLIKQFTLLDEKTPNLQVNVSDWATGTYLLKAVSGKHLHQDKFVVYR